MAYYYLTEKYKPGQILDHLPTGDYTMIMGLEIGPDETGACLSWCKDGEWVTEMLTLDIHGNQRIPTYISYRKTQCSEELVKVGYDVDWLCFTQAFVLPPSQWNNNVDGRHTAAAMERDFAKQVFRQIDGYNPQYGLQGEMEAKKLLVVADFPCAKEWMMTDDYQKLLQDALDYDQVAVLPGVSAAILDEVMQDGRAQSAAVFDLGCFRAEAAYIQPGKKMISRSASLMSTIDEEIFDQLVAEGCLNRQNITLAQEEYLLTQIRRIREEHYRSRSEDTNLYLRPEDRWEGKPPICSVQLDDHFMQKILTEQRAWCHGLCEFFVDMKNLIGGRPCDTVILTGSISLIPEVQGMATAVFGGIVRCEASPQTAAAVRLCNAKGRQVKLGWKRSLQSAVSKLECEPYCNYRTRFLTGLADQAGYEICIPAQKAAWSYLEKKKSVASTQFLKEARMRMNHDFNASVVHDIYKAIFKGLDREEPQPYMYDVDPREPELPPKVFIYYEEMSEELGRMCKESSCWLKGSKEEVQRVFESYLDPLDIEKEAEELKSIFIERAMYAVEEKALPKTLKDMPDRLRRLFSSVEKEERKTKQKREYTLELDSLLRVSDVYRCADFSRGRDKVKKSELLQKQFSNFHQAIFEIILGQNLLLVFEEPADIQ